MFGFEYGDMVVIFGFNCFEWVIFDIVSMMVGGVLVGIYMMCSLFEVVYIIDYVELKFVFVENKV